VSRTFDLSSVPEPAASEVVLDLILLTSSFVMRSVREPDPLPHRFRLPETYIGKTFFSFSVHCPVRPDIVRFARQIFFPPPFVVSS